MADRPVLPYLQPAFPIRASSSFRTSAVKGNRNSGRHQAFGGLFGDSIDHALSSVKDEIRTLWIRSKYRRDFPGIVTFSPDVREKERQLKQSLPLPSPSSPRPPPILVTVKKLPPKLHQDLVAKRPTPLLQVSLPSPLLPAVIRKPSGYRLRKVPSPLKLYKRYGKLVGASRSMDYSVIETGLESEELDSTDECPLTALRSFDIERREDADLQLATNTQKSREGSQRKSGLVAKHHKGKSARRKRKSRAISDFQLRVTQLGRSESFSPAKDLSERRRGAQRPGMRNPNSDSTFLTLSAAH